MPIFLTDDAAETIATKLIELVKANLRENKEHSLRATIGTGLTEVYCRAMLQMFPDPSDEGKDILEVCPKFVASFPDPRRDAIHAAAIAKANSQLDN